MDIDIFLALIATGQTITLQDANVSANYQNWYVTGATTNVNPGAANSYWTVPVSLTSSAGTGTTGFTNNHQLFLAIVTGAVGPTGPTGPTGSSGPTVYPGAGIANSTGTAWGTSYTTTGSGTVVALATSPTFTTNITAPLVIGGTAVSSTINIRSTSGVGTSDAILFSTGSQAERMRITTGGLVGIGTGSPTYLFDTENSSTAVDYIAGRFISAAAATGESRTWLKIEKASTYGGAIGGYLSQAVGSGLILGTQNGVATPVERMRITQAGNVGIGTNAPTNTLDVTGTLHVSGAVTFTTALTAANGGTGATTLTANNVLLGNGTSALQVVAPSTSGNVLTSDGTTWASTAPAASGLTQAAALKLVSLRL